MPDEWNEELTRGDNRTIPFTIYDANDAVVDITGSSAWFTVKALYEDADSAAKITKKNTAAGGGDAQIALTNPTQGEGEIYILPSDTSNLDADEEYVYDLQIKLSGGKTYTAKNSALKVNYDVTLAT